MSKLLTTKNLMQDMTIRELKIMKAWIADEILIKERNQAKMEDKNLPEKLALLQHEVHSDHDYPSDKLDV